MLPALSLDECTRIMNIFATRSCSSEQAQMLQNALRFSYEQHVAARRCSIRCGQRVRIDHEGRTTYGTVKRVSKKTVTVATDTGVQIRASHCLVTVVK